MEQRGPQPSATAGKICESVEVEDDRSKQNQNGRRQGDPSERGSNAADAEFVEGLAAIQAAAQCCSAHHKSLQEGGDRHQTQAPHQDHQGKHPLTEAGQIPPHIDHAQPGDRDG